MEASKNSIFNMSPGYRMALFLGATGISMILGALISFSLVAAYMHVPFNQLQSIILEPANSKIAQFANALASIIAFGLPSIAVAVFTKGSVYNNLGFLIKPKNEQIILVGLLAIAGLFLSGALGDLTDKIPVTVGIKAWADGLEAQYKQALMAMTQMKSIVDLLYAIIAVALVPAVVEELFFRASLQKILMDWSGKPYLAIVVTAILFSAFHFSYFGFLSRMSLGIMLGCIYYFSKSIWLPMLMHFINNAIGITALYIVREDPKKVETVLEGNLTYYWIFVAIIVVYFLLKQLKNNTQNAGLEKSI
jgi:membrane protease YdiL (CAAX protease family)